MAHWKLADSLERAVVHPSNRASLLHGQLVLVSPYDPAAGFNVGHAMQRNKIVYALATASLIVSADYNKGGTWAGAVEQLGRSQRAPLYVRHDNDSSKGLIALAGKGALPWPEPETQDAMSALLEAQVLPHEPAELPATDWQGQLEFASK